MSKLVQSRVSGGTRIRPPFAEWRPNSCTELGEPDGTRTRNPQIDSPRAAFVLQCDVSEVIKQWVHDNATMEDVMFALTLWQANSSANSARQSFEKAKPL